MSVHFPNLNIVSKSKQSAFMPVPRTELVRPGDTGGSGLGLRLSVNVCLRNAV